MRTYVQTVWMETMPSAHDKHEIITLKKSKILVESNRNSTQCTFHDYVEFHLFKAQINFNFICLPIDFKLTFQLWFLQRVAEIGLTLSFPHPLNFIYFLGLRNLSGLGPRRITAHNPSRSNTRAYYKGTYYCISIPRNRSQKDSKMLG